MNQVALNLDFNFFFQGKGGELDKEISWWALMSSLFVGLGAAKSIGGNDVLNKSSAVCLSTGTGGGGELRGGAFFQLIFTKFPF